MGMSSAESVIVDKPLDKLLGEMGGLPVAPTGTNTREQSLRDCVAATMEEYFRNLDGQDVSDVYDMVLQQIEPPLLDIVMQNTRYNQTKAAELLGLNRATLRKKLKRYNLL